MSWADSGRIVSTCGVTNWYKITRTAVCVH